MEKKMGEKEQLLFFILTCGGIIGLTLMTFLLGVKNLRNFFMGWLLLVAAGVFAERSGALYEYVLPFAPDFTAKSLVSLLIFICFLVVPFFTIGVFLEHQKQHKQ